MGNLGLAIDCKPAQLPNIGDNLLGFLEGSQSVLNELLETPHAELGGKDVAVLNLLCAPTLRGSENLDIPKCLARLDSLAALAKDETERSLSSFRTNRHYGHSEPMWRMANLVTIVKRDFGARYSPTARDDLLAGIEATFSDSREVFIHGLLDDDPDRRWGTCASIPVLIAAVARRLHYPVALATTRTHVYARWDGGGTSFNIEASNPAGMTVETDAHYRNLRGGMSAEERKSGYYVRKLSPAEEFSLFLKNRIACLRDAARYDETLLWVARALQFAPDDPNAPKAADYMLSLALKHRLWRKHPTRKLPAPNAPDQPYFHFGELLAVEEFPLCMTIRAHVVEASGNVHEARRQYEAACRHNFHGCNEQRDFQRFLRKHHLPRRIRPLMPPKDPFPPRRVALSCKPHEEAALLHKLADECERSGNFLKAHDAVHDLYMFDPSDPELFERARAIEARPQFQSQLRNAVEHRHREMGTRTVLKRNLSTISSGSNNYVV